MFGGVCFLSFCAVDAPCGPKKQVRKHLTLLPLTKPIQKAKESKVVQIGFLGYVHVFTFCAVDTLWAKSGLVFKYDILHVDLWVLATPPKSE